MRYRLVVGTTLLGFAVGTALLGFVVGAATLSFVAVATTAVAYMPGGGSGGVSHAPSMGIHNSLSSSLGDGRRNTFKKPLDSDGGGQSDPAPKTTGAGSGGAPASGGFYPTPRHPGYQHNPH